MSKKIMKRTAVLSAMIAVALSGTVFAANMTDQTQANEINAGTANYVVDGAINAVGSDIVISGNKNTTVLTVNGGNVAHYDSWGNKASDANAGIGGDFRDTPNETITIKNIKVLNVKGKDFGISTGTDTRPQASYKEVPVGKVFIEDTVETTNITGADFGVFGGGNNTLVQIESKNVMIDAAVVGAITNAGGTINLGTAENKIENLTINSANMAIYGSSNDADINVFADNVTLTSTSNSIRSNGGNIHLGSADAPIGNITIETKNGNVLDVLSSGGSIGVYGGEVSLVTEKANGYVVNAYANAPVTIVGEESLDIKGNILTDRTNAIVNINSGIDDALVNIEGNVKTSARGGSVDITLGAEGSSLKGTITDISSGVTLTMNEDTSWTATGDSYVGTIEGDNGSIKIGMKDDGSLVQVEVGTNNAADLRVGGAGEISDYIVENGDAIVAELADCISIDQGNAINTDTIVIDEGLIGGEFTITQNADGSVTTTQADNTKSDAVSNAGMNLKAHFRAHMNDMNKRMGELRMAKGETGAWARMVRGEYEYEGARSQHNQYQFGYDKKVSSDDTWTVGAAITVSEGSGSYGQGNTEDTSRSFAVYGSRLNDDGSFVDLIARYVDIDSEIADSVYGDGEYGTNGYSFSAEVGKRIEQKGFWIEPQAELTYGTVDSASVLLGGKYRANYDSMDSIVGRLGFSLGKDIKQGNIYARASYLYDFDGESATQFNGGKKIGEDFGGDWWEVGIGANIQVSKAAYIYADVEKTFGGEIETNWQWNLGVRYSF